MKIKVTINATIEYDAIPTDIDHHKSVILNKERRLFIARMVHIFTQPLNKHSIDVQVEEVK